MFCYQCQETAKNEGCTKKGVCGKPAEVANLQDLLICALRGAAIYCEKAKALGIERKGTGRFVTEALFTTVTNVNFDAESISAKVKEAFAIRDELKVLVSAKGGDTPDCMHKCATWSGDEASFVQRGAEVGVLSVENQDVRSLRELLMYGLKGISAYAHHAAVLGKEDQTIYDFLIKGLASTTKDLTQEEMVGLVLEAGEVAVTTMATLDAANTETFGNPEITEVNIGVRGNPGILISGHDLRDLEELLEQTNGTGVDVYTHSEMLPAHYYPAFKKYENFVGNYGGAWYDQKTEFESFNGPILMTTNCLVPPRDSYKDRVYTTGTVRFPGLKHISDREVDGRKDFTAIIEQAKSLTPPTEIETGKIVGGFAHNQVLALADKVVEAVKSGAIKKFIVMAGCDGRQKTRSYFTEVAEALPKDTVILTAGCAKYRYNKLDLGDIGGIPRVLDAGQCNDSYSLAVIALKLKEVFGLEDINDLPIEFDIAWYEQKAVAVLLALLHLGVKGIRLGPTLPAFLSPNVAKVLVETFDIKPTGDAAEDVDAMTR
ncbi:MAG: hydroxylamine reductase [Proteobacteria bacterium]|nr:hydroxylamine reductase [Pseudomonadota bacterium]